MFAHINYHQKKDDGEQSEQWHHSRKQEPETSKHHEEESEEAIAHSIDQHRKDSIKQFTIPTLHIEEADTDSEMDHQRGVPDIEISEFDHNDLIAEEEEEKEFPGPENHEDSPDVYHRGPRRSHTNCVQFWRPSRTSTGHPSNKPVMFQFGTTLCLHFIQYFVFKLYTF